MKKILLSIAMVASAFYANAQCNTQTYVKHIFGAGVTAPSTSYTYLNTPVGSAVQVGRDNVAENFNWVNDTMYVIHGIVRVDSLDALTIEQGTVIMGADQGTLVVQRGGKIFAQGTKRYPIVFTSFQCPGQRAAGDWGGVVICGAAPNNRPGNNGVLEGNYGGFHGGTNAQDNSGVLSYVRIEFSGVALFPNQEINGLTMGSVGRGTQIDHVQVSHNLDDAFEWFGGTVNTKYLVSFKNLDDDFDAADGYIGFNQFGMAVRDPNFADISGSNGFEIDNDGSGSTNLPLTRPIFSNYTVLGPKGTPTSTFNALFDRGAHIRRNSTPQIFNSVIAGWPDAEIYIDGQTTVNNAVSDALKIRNCAFAPSTNPTPIQSTAANWAPYADVMDWFDTPAFEDSIQVSVNALKIRDPYNLSDPKYTLLSGSKLNFGAEFDATANPVFNSAFWSKTITYRGAMGAANWAGTWTEFDPQNFVYNRNGVVRMGAVADVAAIEAGVAPNPTNGITSVNFYMENESEVEISVLNMQGVKVKDVVKGVYGSGENTESFSVSDMIPGLYVVSIKSEVGSKSIILSVE